MELPFSGEIVVADYLEPAKPVLKTSTLKEFTINNGNKLFYERELPTPAHHLSAHGRFTPSYFVFYITWLQLEDMMEMASITPQARNI